MEPTGPEWERLLIPDLFEALLKQQEVAAATFG